MHRLIAAALFPLATAIAVATGVGSAFADFSPSAATDGGGINHSVASEHNAGGGGGGGGAIDDCEYRKLENPGPVHDVDGNVVADDGTGTWYEKYCKGGTEFDGVFYVRPVNPLELLAQARKYLALPLPAPKLSPVHDQVVNLPSWIWIDTAAWQPLTSTVAVPDVSVTVTARPVRMIWSPGDGSTVTCNGPGSPWTASSSGGAPSCAHTYTRSSASQPGLAYSSSLTVVWSASWTTTGAAGGGDLGTINRTAAFAARVGEVQTVNTPSR